MADSKERVKRYLDANKGKKITLSELAGETSASHGELKRLARQFEREGRLKFIGANGSGDMYEIL
jgi:MarR-like DNA-binding transcriptional regulator SgrR of sgrS sRNA